MRLLALIALVCTVVPACIGTPDLNRLFTESLAETLAETRAHNSRARRNAAEDSSDDSRYSYHASNPRKSTLQPPRQPFHSQQRSYLRRLAQCLLRGRDQTERVRHNGPQGCRQASEHQVQLQRASAAGLEEPTGAREILSVQEAGLVQQRIPLQNAGRLLQQPEQHVVGQDRHALQAMAARGLLRPVQAERAARCQ